MEIELIRHFATEGNLEKRYIGVTDEEIKAEFVLEHTLKKEENGREEWKPEACDCQSAQEVQADGRDSFSGSRAGCL